MKGLSSLSLLKGTNYQLYSQRPDSRPTSKESDNDLEPPQFFHYSWSANHKIKRIGYHGDDLNFGKGRHIPLQPFMPKEKSANYYNCTRMKVGICRSVTQSEPESNKSLPSQSSDSFNWDSDISVRVVFKKLFANMMSINQGEQDEYTEPFNTDL